MGKYVCATVLVCKSADGGERWTSGCLLLSLLYLMFWDKVSHWTWRSLFQPSRLAGPWFRGSFYLHPPPPSIDIPGAHGPASAFTRVLVSTLCSKHFNHWAISTAWEFWNQLDRPSTPHLTISLLPFQGALFVCHYLPPLPHPTPISYCDNLDIASSPTLMFLPYQVPNLLIHAKSTMCPWSCG